MGKKLLIWKKGKEKKRAIEKDQNRLKKTKKLFNYAISRKTCLCLMKNSFLAILLAMLISRKPVQEEELVKNAVISLLASRHQRVKESYQFVSNWPFSS